MTLRRMIIVLGFASVAIFLLGTAFLFPRQTAYFGAKLRHEDTCVWPPRLNLGVCNQGEHKQAVFYLKNLTDEPIEVSGEITSCSCVACDDLPLIVQPKEEALLEIQVFLPKKESLYDQSISFLVNERQGLRLRRARVTASVAQ